MTIGSNIKHARGRIKQSELSEMINVDISTISRWENDKNIPSGKMLQKIADALSVDISCLTDESLNENEIKNKSRELKNNQIKERSYTSKEDIGMYTYFFRDGDKIEIPATPENFPLFQKMVEEKRKELINQKSPT